MKTFSYFTDGSIKIKFHENQAIGSCGFILMRDSHIIRRKLVYSNPDINYLECLAINLALIDLATFGTIGNEYVIYTDSLNTRNNLMRIYYSKEIFIPRTPFEIELVNTVNVLKSCVEKGLNFSIVHIRSHCTPSFQQTHLKKSQEFTVSIPQALYINNGNSVIDELCNKKIWEMDNIQTINYCPFAIC